MVMELERAQPAVLAIENPTCLDLFDKRKLLAAKGIATRSKDVTRISWPFY